MRGAARAPGDQPVSVGPLGGPGRPSFVTLPRPARASSDDAGPRRRPPSSNMAMGDPRPGQPRHFRRCCRRALCALESTWLAPGAVRAPEIASATVPGAPAAQYRAEGVQGHPLLCRRLSRRLHTDGVSRRASCPGPAGPPEGPRRRPARGYARPCSVGCIPPRGTIRPPLGASYWVSAKREGRSPWGDAGSGGRRPTGRA